MIDMSYINYRKLNKTESSIGFADAYEVDEIVYEEEFEEASKVYDQFGALVGVLLKRGVYNNDVPTQLLQIDEIMLDPNFVLHEKIRPLVFTLKANQMVNEKAVIELPEECLGRTFKLTEIL